MLRDSLQSDSTSSGKERIEAALQAVAQDPMFVALLRCAQERRDSAFAPSGAKKAAKGSVFKAAAERLNQAREEKERLYQIVVDSQGTEKHLRELTEKRAERQEALDGARDDLAVFERLALQAASCAAAAEQVRLAEEEVKRITKIGTDVQAAELKLAELGKKMAQAEKALQAAREQEQESAAALKSAEEAVRKEGSDPGVTDTVIRQKLELRKVEADRAASDAQQRFDAATNAQRLVEAADAAERDYKKQQAAADRARASSSEAAAKEKHCDGGSSPMRFAGTGVGCTGSRQTSRQDAQRVNSALRAVAHAAFDGCLCIRRPFQQIASANCLHRNVLFRRCLG